MTSGVKSVGAKVRFDRLGNRDLKGVGLIDLYAVTLDEIRPLRRVRLPKRGVSTASKGNRDPLDCCFAVCRSQRRTRSGTLQRWCCGRNPQCIQ